MSLGAISLGLTAPAPGRGPKPPAHASNRNSRIYGTLVPSQVEPHVADPINPGISIGSRFLGRTVTISALKEWRIRDNHSFLWPTVRIPASETALEFSGSGSSDPPDKESDISWGSPILYPTRLLQASQIGQSWRRARSIISWSKVTN